MTAATPSASFVDGHGPLEWFLTNRTLQLGDLPADGVHPNVYAPTDVHFAFGDDTAPTLDHRDTPIVGDWNGDGITTPGIERHTWTTVCD